MPAKTNYRKQFTFSNYAFIVTKVHHTEANGFSRHTVSLSAVKRPK